MKSLRWRAATAVTAFVLAVVGLAVAPPAQASARTAVASNVTFTRITKPKSAYRSATCRYSTDAVPDGTVVSKVKGCGGPVTFNIKMRAVSVPATWSTWGFPPATETGMPHALSSKGATSMILTFPATTEAGFELEPYAFEVESVTAQFMDGSTLIGTITRSPSGSAGALLFAAKVQGATVDKIVVTDNAADEFAIANIRRAR